MQKANNYVKYKLLTAEQFSLIKQAYFPALEESVWPLEFNALEGSVWPLEFNSNVIEYAKALDRLELFEKQHWLQININLFRKQVNVILDPNYIGLVAYTEVRKHFKTLGKITSTDMQYYANQNLIILQPLKFANDSEVYSLVGDLIGSQTDAGRYQVVKRTTIKRERLLTEVNSCQQELEKILGGDLGAFKLITSIS